MARPNHNNMAPPLPQAQCALCGLPIAGPSGMCARCEMAVRGALNPMPGGFTKVASGIIPFGMAAAARQEMAALQQQPLPRGDMILADIIGWRIWRVTGSAYLRSLTAKTIWFPGEPMEAAEVADHGAGKDGVHVFKERAGAVKELSLYLDHVKGASYALGSVLLWGDVVEHERGYRAERAKIVSIDDVVWEGKPPWAEETKKALAFLRERYGVPQGTET